MATARDLIKSALRKISVIGTGASLDAQEADDALEVLNNMLKTWSVSGSMIFSEVSETFPLVDGVADYTIGEGADFDTEKPFDIVSVFVTESTSDYILGRIDRLEYASVFQKQIQTIPEAFYYDNGHPIGTIKLYPTPINMNTITIYSDKPLSKLTSLDAVLNMPEVYETAIIYNLAQWIAPEYEREASFSVKQIAKTSLKAVKVFNNRNDKNVSTVNLPKATIAGSVDRRSFIGGR